MVTAIEQIRDTVAHWDLMPDKQPLILGNPSAAENPVTTIRRVLKKCHAEE